MSGGWVLASMVELGLGATGAIGFIMRYVGPLTIAPTISLVGLALYPAVTNACQHHWGIALV